MSHVLICISMLTNEVEHLLYVFTGHICFFCFEISVHVFCSFFSWDISTLNCYIGTVIFLRNRINFYSKIRILLPNEVGTHYFIY